MKLHGDIIEDYHTVLSGEHPGVDISRYHTLCSRHHKLMCYQDKKRREKWARIIKIFTGLAVLFSATAILIGKKGD